MPAKKRQVRANLPPEVRAYLSALGKKGGATTGPSKARSSEQARKAAQARWATRAKKTSIASAVAPDA